MSIEGFDRVASSITIEKSVRIFLPSVTMATKRPEAPSSALAAGVVSVSKFEVMCLDYAPPPPPACVQLVSD